MAYKHIWEAKGLLAKHYGILTVEEILSSINEMYGNVKFDGISYRIVDLSEVDEIIVAVEDVKKLVAHEVVPSMSNSKLKFAVVSTNEKLPELLAAFKHKGGNIPWEIKIHSTIEEAREWVS